MLELYNQTTPENRKLGFIILICVIGIVAWAFLELTKRRDE